MKNQELKREVNSTHTHTHKRLKTGIEKFANSFIYIRFLIVSIILAGGLAVNGQTITFGNPPVSAEDGSGTNINLTDKFKHTLCKDENWSITVNEVLNGFSVPTNGSITTSYSWKLLNSSADYVTLSNDDKKTAGFAWKNKSLGLSQNLDYKVTVSVVVKDVKKNVVEAVSAEFSAGTGSSYTIQWAEDPSGYLSLGFSKSMPICKGEGFVVEGKSNLSTTWSWSILDAELTGPDISGTIYYTSALIPAALKAGKYKLKGKAMVNIAQCPLEKEATLSLKDLPVASIQSSENIICKGESIALTGSNIGRPTATTSFVWSSNSSGSGLTNSTSQTISVTPLSEGQKVYSLNITDECGLSATTSRTITVNPVPVADFTVPTYISFSDQTNTDYIVNNTLNNSSLGYLPGTTFHWDFKYPNGGMPGQNGLATNNTSPLNYTYSSSGFKLISMTAKGPSPSFCEDRTVEGVYVTEVVNSDFLLPSNNSCESSAVNVIQNSSLVYGGSWGSIVFEWDFGDNSSIQTQTGTPSNISHTYSQAGWYTITLTAYSQHLPNVKFTSTKQLNVKPVPYITAFTTTGHCEDQIITFNDVTNQGLGSGAYLLHEWDWNNDNTVDESHWTTSTFDSRDHIFNSPGTKTIRLRRSYPSGCFAEVTQTLTVDPTPVAIASKSPSDICENGSIDLVGTTSTITSGSIASSQWITRTGPTRQLYSNSANTTLTNGTLLPSYPAYLHDGLYTTTLYATSDLGCVGETSLTFNIWPKPYPDFTSTDACDLNDAATQFTNTTPAVGGTHTFAWDFAGQNTSTLANPNWDFTSDGNFNVSLTVQEDVHNCTETLTKAVNVKPNPVADFTTSNNLCNDQDVVFMDASTTTSGTLSSWVWTWANPNVNPNSGTNVPSASHSYSGSGSYDVKMKVTGSNGCYKEVIKPITISSKPAQPTLTLTETSPVCFKTSYSVNASPTSLPSGSSYSWYLNGNIMGGITTNSYTDNNNTWNAYSLANKQYKVRVTDANGCFNTSPVAAMNIIKLNTGLGFQGGQQNVLCSGESTVLTGVAPVPGHSYDWKLAAYDPISKTFAATYTSVGANSKTHTVDNSAPGRYKFIASNTFGTPTCYEESYITIDVINAPPLTLNYTGTIQIDPSAPLELEAVYNTYPTYSSYEWFLNDKSISTASSFRPIIPGTYYLIAEGSCGLEKSNEVIIELDCNDPSFDMAYRNPQTFSSATTISPSSVIYYKVDGNWDVIASTLTLQDVVIVADNCYALNVYGGAELVLYNASIVGCTSAEWEGIVNEGGSVEMNYASIAGAQVGLLNIMDGNFDIQNANFSDNYVHIGIQDVNAGASVKSIESSNFGNLSQVNSCFNRSVYEWSLTQRPAIYAQNSSAIRIVNNKFTNTIIDPSVESIAIKWENINESNIESNIVMGWYETAVEISNSSSNQMIGNDIEYGFNLNGQYQASFMSSSPVPMHLFPVNGLYMYNSDGNSIAQNEFYGLERGMEFYQVKSNPTVTTITKNKFSNNGVGILSSTNVDPTTAPPGLNSNNAVAVQVNCNNFASNTYGWLGTGTYPNQGDVNTSTGNVYTNNVQWDQLVTRNGKTYYYNGYIPNTAFALQFAPVSLDGISMNTTNSIFPSLANNPRNCTGMRLKADSETINGVEDELASVDFAKPVVYPNPFTYSFQVKVNSEANYAIQVIDLNGSVIFTKMDASGNENIVLDGIRKGVYIVTITSGESVFHYRLVKAQ